MASINGITLKALKKFTGHEGECLQGNIYLENKKIGFWSQDSHGGPDDIILDEGFSERKLQEKIRELNKHKAVHGKRADGTEYTIEYGFEKLAYDLAILLDDEKAYKKAIKKGYSVLLTVTDGFHVVEWSLGSKYAEMPYDVLLENLKDNISEAKKNAGFFKETAVSRHEIKLYRSEKDFNVGEKISLDDIRGGEK